MKTKKITVTPSGLINPTGIGTNQRKFEKMLQDGWQILDKKESRSFGGSRVTKTVYIMGKE
jgi:hypothetical protein